MNNYANDAQDGGLPLRAGFSRARRDAAYQACFEAMPVFPRGRSRIYRTQAHGRTVDLMMLDERQYRADQPCGDAIAFPCRSWDRPRSLLGRRQLAFLEGRLSNSTAAWKVIGGQSLMMPNRVHDGAVPALRLLAGLPAGARAPAPAHRARRGIKDVVFLTGDVHTVMAGDVLHRHGRRAAGGGRVRRRARSRRRRSGESNFRMPGGQLIPGNDAEPVHAAGDPGPLPRR